MHIILFLFLLNFMIASQVATAKENVCTQQEAIQAETESSSLEDWASVYRSFTKYSHCDDAAISEGYSSSVANLLARNWQQFEILYRLTSKNRRFEYFLLRHIDQTWSIDDAGLVTVNAREHCPPKTLKLCRKIIKTIEQEGEKALHK